MAEARGSTVLASPDGRGAQSRWYARADSIRGVEEELSRIWSSAAQEVEEATLSPSAEADALGDPRLGAHLGRESDVRVRTRTSVLTLVVVAARPETTERAVDTINTLSRQHPSRAIVVAPGDPDGPATIDAQIHAACHLADGSSTETCTEQIILRTGGELAWHLSGVVTPLLIHDLPVMLWWPDDPPIGRRPFDELIEITDRLLVDTGSFRHDDGGRLSALSKVAADTGTVVCDIGWMRLRLWRELLAGIFDHPLLMPELRSIRNLRIDIAKPGDTFRVARGVSFAGWLATMLDWQVARPLAPVEGSDRLVGSFRQGRSTVGVELRPVSGSLDRSVRTAGSLARVELELGRRDANIRARVTRQADHLLATADWNGAQVTRRAGRLEAFGEAPYVAEALEWSGQDRLFAEALNHATRLLGSVAAT